MLFRSLGPSFLARAGPENSGPSDDLLVLGRIALLAGLPVFLGLDAALVLAFLASRFGFVAAGFGVRERETAKEDEGGDNCTDGLHVLPFLPEHGGCGRRLLLLDPITNHGDSTVTSWVNYRRL